MAGNAETGKSIDVRAANWLAEKSAVVGLIALGVGIVVPPIAPFALSVAGVEGLEFAGAKVYVDMREGRQYSVKTRKEAALAA